MAIRGADTDVEEPSLAEQVFDAALAELAVVRVQPCLIAGDLFQRGVHQDPLLELRDLGWALG